MINIPGYQASEKVYQDDRATLYRGWRELDGLKVWIKSLRINYPSVMDRTALKSEFELTKKLSLPGVLKPLAVDLSRGILISEHFDGEPPDPKSFLETHGLGALIRLAIEAVGVLQEVHQHNIIHQSLRPINILYDDASNEVRLQGFAVACLKEEKVSPEGLKGLLSMLTYLSPEQTGRLSRKVGPASDLYALGITLYELLTGRVPFQTDDPIELVHCHLARKPENPMKHNSNIPEPLAMIVLRLLNKNPEDRYRSLYGLKRDLIHCEESWQNARMIDPFELGAHDVSQQFILPQRLYGRELEMRKAREAYRKVCRGQARLWMVGGVSGIGKSALVHELRNVVADSHGYFVSGSGEHNKTQIPYKPFIQAFDDLIHQILGESPNEVEAWRQRLLDALGITGQVLVDVVPDLELIIGQQGEIPHLETAESKNRFHVALLKFIHTVATREHPLVIFIDDLQWVGASTLELLEALLTDPQMSYLMVVCAARESEELDLSNFTYKLQSGGVIVETTQLLPIDLVEIQAMLRDALHTTPEENRSLADLALERTGGNPFYINVYLQSLYEKGLLAFMTKTGRWNWDAALISSNRANSQDIMDLVMEKIQEMPETTLSVMKLASCIGTRFSLKMLAIAHQHSQSETASALIPAVKKGLLVPVGDSHILSDICNAEELEAMADEHIEIAYEFLHGRVQQAVYELMDPATSKETHLRVGQLFLKYNQANLMEEQVFGIVNQLNFGRELVEDVEEQLQLARLNLSAGNKARDAVAYSDARDYLSVAYRLLPMDARDRDYNLWFDVSLQLAEMEYYCGNISEADRHFSQVLEDARYLKDKARVYETRVLIFNTIGRLEEAVRIGLEGLRLFGIHIPESTRITASVIEEHRLKVLQWLDTHEHADILALPRAESEEHLHVVTLLMQITPACFNTNQELFKLVALLQMEQLIEHGYTRLSAYALATLGILLGMYGRYREGYEMAQLALDLNRQYPDPLIRNRLQFIGCNLVNHWCRHLRKDLPTLASVFRYADDNGDLVYANYAQLVLSHHRWFLGDPLLKIIDEAEQHRSYAAQTRNDTARECHDFMVHASLNLRGLTRSANSLDTEEFKAEKCHERLINSGYFTGASICTIIHAEVLYLRGRGEEALTMIDKSGELLHFSDNLVMMVLHEFNHGLILAATHHLFSPSTRAHNMKTLETIRGHFERWSLNCPENFGHMYHLLCAEIERLQENHLVCQQHYQKAIQGAADHGFRKNEALAHELAARYFFTHSFLPYAEYHLRSSLTAWLDWGAIAKVDDLRSEFSQALRNPVLTANFKGGPAPPTAERSLDKITLLKAAQAISSEIHIEGLLNKMLRFVVENAGAQRGLFIYNHQGRLMVEAEWHVDQEEVGIPDEMPLNARNDLAKPVIHYVYRTRTDLVIGDMARNKQFVGDRYLKDSGVKSVLCMPVLRKTELLGLLYLENHLASDTFSEERLEMLRLLTPQMAVSLENARYIDNMARLNDTLQKEVTERERAEKGLRKAQDIAIANAHNAGKAEFANSVLHNINNVLNTVGLSCQTMRTVVHKSKVENFNKAMAMVREHQGNLAHFFSENKRGQLLPNYLADLGEVMHEERTSLEGELDVLHKHIKLMKDIIETQQRHAKGVLAAERVDLVLLVEDALSIQRQALERHHIEVVRNYQTERAVTAKKAELTHILINLVKNAVEAMGFQEKRVMTLTTGIDEDQVYLEVADTGTGITEEEMSGLFTHGFTTKEEGHGFGLHYCRQAMQDIGGSIQVTSEGRDKGARFILTFARD